MPVTLPMAIKTTSKIKEIYYLDFGTLNLIIEVLLEQHLHKRARLVFHPFFKCRIFYASLGGGLRIDPAKRLPNGIPDPALLILTEAAALALAGELVFSGEHRLPVARQTIFVWVWTQLSPFGISW